MAIDAFTVNGSRPDNVRYNPSFDIDASHEISIAPKTIDGILASWDFPRRAQDGDSFGVRDAQ